MLLLSDDPEIRDPELGMQWLEYAARNRNDRAAYRLGKEYLKGDVVNRDTSKAEEYLTQSADAGNQYAQYALGKLYLERNDKAEGHYPVHTVYHSGQRVRSVLSEPLGQLEATIGDAVCHAVAAPHESHLSRAEPSSAVPGGIRIDRKRLARLREKKIAMGRKPDDHEELQTGITIGGM